MRAHRRLGSVAAALAVAAVLSGCGLGAGNGGARGTAPRASAPVLPPVALQITAFQPAYSSPSRIDASAAALSWVGVDGIDIGVGGTSVTSSPPNVTRQRDRAHALGLKAEVLLLNYAPGVGFSNSVAASMLGTAANREAAAASLAQVVKDEHWDGVMLDLESLHAADASGLTAFAKALRADVGPSIRLDAAIQPSTSPRGYASIGYNVKALAKYLDHFTLMAYDQHGTYNPTNPGPVGALSWQKACLTAFLKLAPASKVDLGSAGYGYRWSGPVGAKSVSDASARALVAADGAKAHFSHSAAEWTATLSDGTILWWADARSLPYREALAQTERLDGVSVWSLAVSDPIAPITVPSAATSG